MISDTKTTNDLDTFCWLVLR